MRGSAPSGRLKVALNMVGGYRNQPDLVLTGLDVGAKAELALAGLRDAYPHRFTHQLVRLDRPDAPTNEQAASLLRVSVRGEDPSAVGRAFSGTAVELALASYPGFTLSGQPSDATPYGAYWPALVDAAEVEQVVVHPDGRREVVPHTPDATPTTGWLAFSPGSPAPLPDGPTRRLPLGTLIGARSGDKGGNANVGFWARTDAASAWLDAWLTEDAFRRLLPEADGLEVQVHRLPHLRAVNVVVVGLLGEGVAASTRFDPQAMSLGEYLRSREVDLPVTLLR